jgi:hypothetical protein
MNTKTSKLLFTLCAVLAICMLPMTFVWLEIGPLGKAYYGPTVPDIFIKGGSITGKDLRFEPISFAMWFQRLTMIVFAGISFVSMLIIARKKIVLLFAKLNAVLLLLFPLWLWLYVDVVISNSDGAAEDLTVHYGPGCIAYFVVLLFTVINLTLLFYSNKKAH